MKSDYNKENQRMDDLVVVNFLSKKRDIGQSRSYANSVKNFARLNLSSLENEIETPRKLTSSRSIRTNRAPAMTSRSALSVNTKKIEKPKKETKKFVDHHVLEQVIQERHAEALQADKEQENQKRKARFKIDRRNLPPEQPPSSRENYRLYYWG